MEQVKKGLQLRRKISYWKKVAKAIDSSTKASGVQSYTESLKLQIETLQHEKLELEEKINAFYFYRNGQ